MTKLFSLRVEQFIKIWETISLLLLTLINLLKLILSCLKAISEEGLVNFIPSNIMRQLKTLKKVHKLNRLMRRKETLGFQMDLDVATMH